MPGEPGETLALTSTKISHPLKHRLVAPDGEIGVGGGAGDRVGGVAR